MTNNKWPHAARLIHHLLLVISYLSLNETTMPSPALVRHEDDAPRERSTCGRMRVLVVGVPDIADDDVFFPDEE